VVCPPRTNNPRGVATVTKFILGFFMFLTSYHAPLSWLYRSTVFVASFDKVIPPNV